MKTITVMLCGVGGQGTILAADVIARVAVKYGCDVKLSEVHGMAQRGGSVSTIVRFGDHVNAPTTDPGNVDVLVAFERLEAIRYLHYLAPNGYAVVNTQEIDPLVVATGVVELNDSFYSELEADNVTLLHAYELALSINAPRSANVVLLGALSKHLPFPKELWLDVLASRVPPKTVSANIDAFNCGCECNK